MSQEDVDLPQLETGAYRHSKTGNVYDVIGVALSTEDNIPMVVYAPQQDSTHKLYVRPYEMFAESVEIDGTVMPRFKKIED